MNAINKYVAGLQDKTTRLSRQIEEFKRRLSELGQFSSMFFGLKADTSG